MKSNYFYSSALVFMLITITLQVKSQAPNWLWVKPTTLNVIYDNQRAVTTDPSGNIIAAGHFQDSVITFGTITLTSSGYRDVFLVKRDPSGNVIWAKNSNSYFDEQANAVATDAAGNIYITGTFLGDSIKFDNITLYNSTTGMSDIFLVKYDPSGNVVWAKTATGTGWDDANSVCVDQSGNVLICGGFSGTSITFGTVSLSNTTSNYSDFFVAKYSSAGNLIWAKRAGGNYSDNALSIASDSLNNVAITGEYASANFSFASSVITNSMASVKEFFVAKYDSSGNELWAKSAGFGAGNAEDGGNSVAFDATGNIYVGGYFGSTSITFGTTTLTNTGSGTTDIFLTKYDPNGNAIWAKSAVGSSSYDRTNAICIDPSGNVLITGYFWSNSLIFGTTTLTKLGGTDIFVAKYDASGNVLWAKNPTGASNQEAFCITRDASGNAIIGGFYVSNTSFGSINLTGNGIFIAKLVPGPTDIDELTNENKPVLFPNPSYNYSMLELTLDHESSISIDVYNLLGENVNSVFHGMLSSGKHSFELNGKKLENGLYFASIKTDTKTYLVKWIISK